MRYTSPHTHSLIHSLRLHASYNSITTIVIIHTPTTQRRRAVHTSLLSTTSTNVDCVCVSSPSCWERPSLLFWVRARPEGTRPKMSTARWGSQGGGSQPLPTIAKGSGLWKSAVSSPPGGLRRPLKGSLGCQKRQTASRETCWGPSSGAWPIWPPKSA